MEKLNETVKKKHGDNSPSFGLNSKLIKRDGALYEDKWKIGGMYGEKIEKIVYWLEKAREVAENDRQKKVISLLVEYYRTGNLDIFDLYSIEWIKETEGSVDFINGFIEVYVTLWALKGRGKVWWNILTLRPLKEQ